MSFACHSERSEESSRTSVAWSACGYLTALFVNGLAVGACLPALSLSNGQAMGCRQRIACKQAPTPSHFSLKFLLLFLATFSLARAHDPYEAWASANVLPDRFILIVTMAQSTATRLIEPDARVAAIQRENFTQLQPHLLRAAAKLFVLTASRKPLQPEKREVELTDENDIIFTLTYPRPPPGKLHFQAAFLARLGQGYGSMLEVLAPPAKELGWEKLSFENPSFEVTIPPKG
jgi:hypothetical protein